MSDEKEAPKAKKAKEETGGDALKEFKRYAIAAIVGPRVVQLRPPQLKKLVDISLAAADEILKLSGE